MSLNSLTKEVLIFNTPYKIRYYLQGYIIVSFHFWTIGTISIIESLALRELLFTYICTRAFGSRYGRKLLLTIEIWETYVITQTIFVVWYWHYIRNLHIRLPQYTCWNHVSGTILKFVWNLFVNNNKYLPHVVDNIIFGISVPDYPSRTVESNSLRSFRNFTISCLLYTHINNNKFTCDKFRTAKFSTFDMFSQVLLKLFTFLINITNIEIHYMYMKFFYSLVFNRNRTNKQTNIHNFISTVCTLGTPSQCCSWEASWQD